MAITIMGGLFVATFLTLLYLPGLYALWFRNSLKKAARAKMLILRRNIRANQNPHFRLPRPRNN